MKLEQLEELLISSNFLNEGDAFSLMCNEEGFDYLAVGNSITKHEICDYWWAEIGMAATSEKFDYYYLVCDGLRNKYGKINATAYNFSMWEIVNTDRAQTIQLIEPYLNEYIDLITIQLGENIADNTTLRTDLDYLLTYIEEKCPNAQIIFVGSFWPCEITDKCISEIVKLHGHEYIDLSEIAMKDEYMCRMGTIVEGEDGKEYVVKHSGVAKHPNDKAFEWYAEKILGLIEE